MANVTVNRDTKDDDPFASASPLQLQALGMIPTANAKQDQKAAQEELLKQRILDFKREYNQTVGNAYISTNDAVEYYAGAISTLNDAFERGYRRKQYQMSAHASQLDWEEWEARDEEAISEARLDTGATDDVIAAGLGVDTSLARMVSSWQVRGEAFEADRSMDGRNRATDDTPEVAREAISLPITHVDYELSQREIQNSMNFGESVDDTAAEEAGETLAVAQEELMFDGWDVEFHVEGVGMATVDGYTTTDYRLAIAGSDWSVPDNVLADIEAAMGQLHGQTADENRGASVQDGAFLYFPRSRWTDITFPADPKGDGSLSLRDRIEQDYSWLTLRQSGVLDANEAVMVVMDRKFVDIADAQTATNFSWDVEGGFGTRFKALNARIPRLKGTYGPDAETQDDSTVGIAHITGI